MRDGVWWWSCAMIIARMEQAGRRLLREVSVAENGIDDEVHFTVYPVCREGD